MVVAYVFPNICPYPVGWHNDRSMQWGHDLWQGNFQPSEESVKKKNAILLSLFYQYVEEAVV